MPNSRLSSGGSAGACSVVGLATTFEDDFKTEIAADADPTLKTTNLEQSSSIATGLIQWGGDYIPICTCRDGFARAGGGGTMADGANSGIEGNSCGTRKCGGVFFNVPASASRPIAVTADCPTVSMI